MATIEEHLAGLSPEALRDLARNHATRPEFRWAAAKRLVELGHRYAEHPEVVGLARPFWIPLRDEYGDPVEPSIEAEVRPETEQEVVVGLGPDESFGPFQASITTDVLMQNEVVEPLDPEPNEPVATEPIVLLHEPADPFALD